MLDPLGKLLIELRDDVEVDALVDGRVRGMEPAAGDAQPKGSYKAFVVIVALGGNRFARAPIQTPRYAINCYGRTPQEAMSLYGACSDAIHHLGPRLHANGQGIYISMDEEGGEADTDPDTKQPRVSAVVSLIATTQAVTV